LPLFFFDSCAISSLTHVLFRNVLFNLHTWDYLDIGCFISFYLLKFASGPRTCSTLVNVQCDLENKV
jgi:hypothetical protein